MGCYHTNNLCAKYLVRGKLRLYSGCKFRYLLRNFTRVAKTPNSLDPHENALLSNPCLACNNIFKNTKLKRLNADSTSENIFSNSCRGVHYFYTVRFYSSNGDAFKADAPIGILPDTPTAFRLGSLGVRLNESYNRLSRHINAYFKSKEVPLVSLTGNKSLVRSPQRHRLQRRSHGQRATRERRVFHPKDTSPSKRENVQDTTETQPVMHTTLHTYSGLQLFHVSSLASRFGESYNYVANHINSAFSQGPAKEVQMPQTAEEFNKRHKSRKPLRDNIQTSTESKEPGTEMEANIAQCSTMENKDIHNNIGEGYLYFARHINRYFGAKVADKDDQDQYQKNKLEMENRSIHQNKLPTQSSKYHIAQRHLKQEEAIPKTEGFFHTSSNTPNFGESYLQMANHINRYFKGKGALEEEVDIDHMQSVSSQKLKAVSFMDCIRNPTSAIPNLLGNYLQSKPATQPLEITFNGRVFLNRRHAEDMAHGLIGRLGQAFSPYDLTACVEVLNEHLIRYPSCKAILWQEKIAVKLLKKRRSYRDNQELQNAIRETLALIGYADPVKGCGIRVLSIDGGGTRGVVPLQVLKLLEAETGKQIHQLFDYICGVSTGAVLAFMLGLARFSLDECADMYRRFGSDVFRQNRLVGTVKMGWSHSYYNTETWEMILKEKIGEKVLIATARDELTPKVSAVSAVVNWGKSPKAFVFRNYNHTPGSLSRYAGGSGYQLWQAVRASSAAPGYFQEFPLQSDIHQDGGIILNNPCALAVHESRLLWPKQPFQCVLSLGTGRFDSVKRGPATSTSLRAKISNLISSATDTEGVHTLLDDLLAPDVYFRFNPMLSAEVCLDESRPMVLDQLQKDTHTYLERNHPKLARLCLVLGAERTAVSMTKDWMSERVWEMKQRWV